MGCSGSSPAASEMMDRQRGKAVRGLKGQRISGSKFIMSVSASFLPCFCRSVSRVSSVSLSLSLSVYVCVCCLHVSAVSPCFTVSPPFFPTSSAPHRPTDLASLMAGKTDRSKLVGNVRKGVAMDKRRTLWPQLALAPGFYQLYKSLYDVLLAVGPSEYDDIIRADVGRTLPHLPFFGGVESVGPGQGQLYRILTAYANLDRRVGYCQGMNFLAGLFVAVGIPEKVAFFTFASTMLRFGLDGLYAPGLPQLHVATQTINILLGRRQPDVFKHLQCLGLSAALYATPWLMSAFVSCPLPLSSSVVVIDLLLCETEPSPLPAFVASTFGSLSLLSVPTHHRLSESPTPTSSVRPGSVSSPARKPSPAPVVPTKPKQASNSPTIPIVLIRACVVIISQLEPELLAASSMEDAFRVLKGEDPEFTAEFDNVRVTSSSAHTLQPPPSATNATHTTAKVMPSTSIHRGSDSAADRGHTRGRRGSVASLGRPVVEGSTSAVAHFMRSLELLDGMEAPPDELLRPVSARSTASAPVGHRDRGRDHHSLSTVKPPHDVHTKPVISLLPPVGLSTAETCQFRGKSPRPLKRSRSSARSSFSAEQRPDADKWLCDNKVIFSWMRPKPYRLLLNSPVHAITKKHLARVARSSRKLSLAAFQQ